MITLHRILLIPLYISWAILITTPVFSIEPWDFFSIHAFDHLDNLDRQAEPAYQCGVSVLYISGVGVFGYMGIPPANEWEKIKDDAKKYVQHVRSLGIPVVIGYLCSTSIVRLNTFDSNFPPDLKNQLSTPPKEWLQQDVNGEALPSWYGAEYNPACMNNPDWRKYQKYMLKTQLEIGVDGIFFDNPTVHPNGCYCQYCMNSFLNFLSANGEKIENTSLSELRELARNRTKDFKKFRCIIARDFLADMRNFAREINPKAIITANNSLNSPEVIFSQCHKYGYNIKEMSKSQDFVVIEDMVSTPRRTSQGNFIECRPTYDLVNSVIGKQLVAVTIGDGDYHTPPNLTKLAIFEAFTRNTNYMLWPTWEESKRDIMIKTISPFVKWLKQIYPELIDSKDIYDVMLYFPFEEWINHPECRDLEIARILTKENIPYIVASEGNFNNHFPKTKIIISTNPNAIPPQFTLPLSELCAKNNKVFIDASNNSFLASLKNCLPEPSLKLNPNNGLRAVIKEKQDKIFILIYNLNIERISTYEDKVTPAKNIHISIKITQPEIEKILVLTPDIPPESIHYEISTSPKGFSHISLHLPELPIAGIVKICLRG